MILDQALFLSTSPQSGVRIHVKCDQCGKERYSCKGDITDSKYGTYTLCKSCSIGNVGRQNKGKLPNPRAIEVMRDIHKRRIGTHLSDETKKRIGNANRRHGTEVRTKIRHRYHNLLHSFLRRASLQKESKSSELLGYTPKMLKIHLEGMFTCEMGWDKRSSFDIDHIFPISQFLEYGLTRVSLVNCLDNLRPLNPAENSGRCKSMPKDLFFRWLFSCGILLDSEVIHLESTHGIKKHHYV